MDSTPQPTDAWHAYLELMKARPALFAQNDSLEIITDPLVVQAFEQRSHKTIGVVYQSAHHLLLVDLVRHQKHGEANKPLDEGCFAYERIVPVNFGAVVAVPLFQNRFVLLKQYRHALRQIQYAFPRGFGEAGLSAEQNLRKELSEEIGASHVQNVVHLGKIAPDSGLSANLVDIFTCEVEYPKEKIGYEEIEGVILLQPCELEDWIAQGKINDGFTLGAYELYRTGANSRGTNSRGANARTHEPVAHEPVAHDGD